MLHLTKDVSVTVLCGVALSCCTSSFQLSGWHAEKGQMPYRSITIPMLSHQDCIATGHCITVTGYHFVNILDNQADRLRLQHTDAESCKTFFCDCFVGISTVLLHESLASQAADVLRLSSATEYIPIWPKLHDAALTLF